MSASEAERFEGTPEATPACGAATDRRGRGAGHIWYDFLWDVIPHRDRFNRRWDDKWFPKMGP